MPDQQPWHRLFGLSWKDRLAGQPVTVEAEPDLSAKLQRLDLTIVRQDELKLESPLPDGLEELALHNLISFKSFQEPLDGEAIEELIGHGVNYRKQASPSLGDQLPLTHFRQFAVCVRTPAKLMRELPDELALRPVKPGVYDLPRHIRPHVIRVIVIHELPLEPQNVMLLLFSADEARVRYASRHYRPHSKDTSEFLFELFKRYAEEGTPMSFDLDEYARELREKHTKWAFERATPQEILKAMSVEQLLEVIPVEKLLEGIPVEKRVEGLSVEALKALLRKLKGEGPAPT